MNLDSARSLVQVLSQKFGFATRAEGAIGAAGISAPAVHGIVGVGVSVRGGKQSDYGVAIRLRSNDPVVREHARAAVGDLPPGEVDIQYAGRIQALPVIKRKHRRGGRPPKKPGPLRIGDSIGHERLPGAGTLGCFVAGDGEPAPRYGVMSNAHVLSPFGAAVGDAIVSPGQRDGGRIPDHRVGTLLRGSNISSELANELDVAVAELPDAGRVTSPTQVLGTGIRLT